MLPCQQRVFAAGTFFYPSSKLRTRRGALAERRNLNKCSNNSTLRTTCLEPSAWKCRFPLTWVEIPAPDQIELLMPTFETEKKRKAKVRGVRGEVEKSERLHQPVCAHHEYLYSCIPACMLPRNPTPLTHTPPGNSIIHNLHVSKGSPVGGIIK